MDQKDDNGSGGMALRVIIKEVKKTIFIVIWRKTRVFLSRGVQVWPFFSRFNFS